MRITLLGSSGNRCTPWGPCTCRVCEIARTHGGKDVRMGNCTYIHDEGILIDAPESIFWQLAKNRITRLEHVFISHWHPDHTSGLRVLQTSWRGMGPSRTHDALNVYMSQLTYDETIAKTSPGLAHYLKVFGARLHILAEDVPITIGSVTITTLGARQAPQSTENDVNFFLVEKDGKRALIAPDETRYLPIEKVGKLDLLIKECGLFEKTVDGEQLLPLDATGWWKDELKFSEGVEQIKRIGASRTVLTEIEELFQRTHAELEAEAAAYPDARIEIGHDGLTIEL